ncbi:MAG: glycosyltransferase family 2 protein [Nitrososphaerota archaeon]
METVNKILATVKGYGFKNMETWVIIDEKNYKDTMKYNCDRLVIVPSIFESTCLYKSRSLEYARRMRVNMYVRGELDDNYIVIQSDDDSLPSYDFMKEAIEVNSDITIGTITPRPLGHLVVDYERPVACGMTCLFFTNIGIPVWAHGEGMVISARVDLNVSYEHDSKPLISSEDMFYTHKTAYLAEDAYYADKSSRNSYKLYCSPKKVFISPPLNPRDTITQRRRWLWGHIRIIKNRMLSAKSLVTIGIAESIGLITYAVATAGAILVPLGVIQLPPHSLALSYASLAMWFAMRGYNTGRVMGIIQGARAALLSYITVTLNFAYHIIGLLKGDPKRFDVIKKYIPDKQ